MNEADILQTLAEVGIALTGFTGIVVAVARRSRGDWTPVELGQLHDLLWTSLVVVFFSFLPIVLVRALTPETTWRLASAALTLMELVFFSHYWWRGFHFFRTKTPMPVWGVRIGFIAIPLQFASVVAKGAVAFGSWLHLAPFIYLASLLLALAAAGVNFVYLLLPRGPRAA